VGAPTEVLDLVERFARNRDAYLSGAYNETQVRREFIDPLFGALGWDVENRAGYAEAYKDVVHEDAIKTSAGTKAPDYCFRVGGTRKFFVEAKKPSVNVKEDVAPAYQLRRYAWSAKLPLSILSDFEEFAVYDTRMRPDKADKASTGRTTYLTYHDYDAKWDEIASVFSKEAVYQGSFDRYAETTKGKRGTAEVDAAFLKEIEEWRDLLARTVALRNPSLTQRELNFAVQTTIDRIIFLRICEDRGIEDYGRLQTLLNGSQTYARLVELYRHADGRYNSGLFHFERERGRVETPDELTPGLTIDDKALKDILRRLYYPDSPYEFSVLPADILGQVYEQFLGKVIRLTAGHRAVIEDKPEVKKAGGVYYTPTYVVDYIVKNTVGKLLEGKTPKQASELRILDPACGSGSFLIGAYQYLLDWHHDRYVADGPQKHKKELFLGPGGEWRLTTGEKKRILLSTIYGVDIDAQAVETTKLSLLLKVLEGETSETINAQLTFLHERALPDLASNIKCGNSLVGPDFYQGEQLALLLDSEQAQRINVFDWETQFPHILAPSLSSDNRGFDALIGNPPWLMAGYWEKPTLDFMRDEYRCAAGKFDLYYLFLEKSLQLVSEQGRVGMIVPNKLFHTKAASNLRGLLGGTSSLAQVVDFGDEHIFKGAANYACILLMDMAQASTKTNYRRAAKGLDILHDYSVETSALGSSPWHFAPDSHRALFQRLRDTNPPLSEFVSRFATGVQTGADKILVLDEEQAHQLGLEAPLLRRILRGRDVRRFAVGREKRVMLFPYRVREGAFEILDEADLAEYVSVMAYLERHKARLARRVWFGKTATQTSGHWYGLMYLEPLSSISQPHFLTPSLSNVSNFALGTGDLFATGTAGVTGLVISDRHREDALYLLGLLNSTLLSFYITHHSPVFAGGYHKFSAPYLRTVPIRRIVWSDAAETTAHDRVVSLVRGIMRAKDQKADVRSPQERDGLLRQVQILSNQLDEIVYHLYGVTDDEVAFIEKELARNEG
jgi:hypothetical protein